jgi:hypothetical protein
VAAAGAVAALVAVIVSAAVSSADGAPRGAILTSAPAVADPPLQHAHLPACSVGDAEGSSALVLAGSCAGRLSGGFRCVNEGEVQAVAVRRRLPAGRTLYLTIVIPEFEGPGVYAQDDVSAQVVGRGAATLRWTNLNDGVEIDATRPGVYALEPGALLPDPGTPTSGVITISGRVRCG